MTERRNTPLEAMEASVILYLAHNDMALANLWLRTMSHADRQTILMAALDGLRSLRSAPSGAPLRQKQSETPAAGALRYSAWDSEASPQTEE